MKISAEIRPGFVLKPEGVRYSVLRNGEVLPDCVAVDTDAGQAWVHRRDSDGKRVLNDAQNQILEDMVTGVMTLKLLPT